MWHVASNIKYTIRSIVCEASCHSVTWSLGHLVTWSLSHSVTWSLSHLVTSSSIDSESFVQYYYGLTNNIRIYRYASQTNILIQASATLKDCLSPSIIYPSLYLSIYLNLISASFRWALILFRRRSLRTERSLCPAMTRLPSKLS